MAASKLGTRNNIISMERQASVFTSAVALSNDFTIPANTGRITCYPSAACHWHPNGTATSTFGHAIEANEPFDIEPSQVGTASIIGDAGSFTMIVAYLRGSGRADGGGSVSRPY